MKIQTKYIPLLFCYKTMSSVFEEYFLKLLPKKIEKYKCFQKLLDMIFITNTISFFGCTSLHDKKYLARSHSYAGQMPQMLATMTKMR